MIKILMSLFLILWSFNAFSAVYKVNTGQSHFEVRTEKAGLMKKFAHRHIIHASKEDQYTRGSVEIEGGVIKNFQFSTDARQLVVADPGVDEGDKKDILKTALSDEVLDANKHSEISFVSTKISGGPPEVTVDGTLKLHGKSQSVQFKAKVSLEENKATATGGFTIKQSSYGITPFSMMLGAIKVPDPVEISFNIVAEKSE